ncbi:MAG: biotin/lipoyl-binding protein [Eubacteriales bacterium]|nr:biotin/lipoyl-binding protein [Eubacteriales bacterium]
MKSSQSRTVWLRALAIFLLIMLVCTVLSRIAASFTVAQVVVVNPTERRITHTVTVGGVVEKNKERVVFTQPNILVRSISVQVGQSVKKGSVLMQLDSNSLQEQIDLVSSSIRELERGIARAKEDDAYTREKMQWEVNVAAQKVKQAKDTLARYRRLSSDKKDQATGEQLVQAVSTAQEEYARALMTQKEELRASSRAVEDAQNASGENGSLDSLYKKWKKLKRLKKKDGKICASKSGVITEIITGAGQMTADTAVLKMSDNRAGLRFVTQITKDDAEYVSVGDEVTVKIADQDIEGVTIDSLEANETGEMLNATVIVPAKKLSIGQSGEMTLTRDSEKYSCTVPIMALSQENNRSFVYVIDEKETVLGTQTIARKVEVTVLDKNDSYAAIESSELNAQSEVIEDMDRYVEEGDRVRLADY